MILLLAILAVFLVMWFTSELPEVGIALIVAVPIIQALI